MMPGYGKIYSYLTVWCGFCDEWHYLQSTFKKHGAKEARKAGWMKRKGLWMCPRCYGTDTPDPAPEDGSNDGSGGPTVGMVEMEWAEMIRKLKKS